MSELQEDGGQGERDEETRGEAGQVGEVGGVGERPPNVLITAGVRRRRQGKPHSDR